MKKSRGLNGGDLLLPVLAKEAGEIVALHCLLDSGALELRLPDFCHDQRFRFIDGSYDLVARVELAMDGADIVFRVHKSGSLAFSPALTYNLRHVRFILNDVEPLLRMLLGAVRLTRETAASDAAA